MYRMQQFHANDVNFRLSMLSLAMTGKMITNCAARIVYMFTNHGKTTGELSSNVANCVADTIDSTADARVSSTTSDRRTQYFARSDLLRIM